MVSSRGGLTVKQINDNINKCKRALYSLVGCSLFKTSLSPCALSKLYWSVSVPILVSCAEVRAFSDVEIDMYETFHRSMAKDIQLLPMHTANAAVLSLLGWRDISTHIDYLKLLFIQRLLSLDPTSIYHIVFIRRFYEILGSKIYTSISPVAQILKLCHKYRILPQVLNCIESGIIPSKNTWKHWTASVLNDFNHHMWHFEVHLYRKLDVFRTVVIKIEPSVWWIIAKSQPSLKRQCCTVIRLLCGVSTLNAHKNVNVPRHARTCGLCNLNEIEDTFHLVVRCTLMVDLRRWLFTEMVKSLSQECLDTLYGLSDAMIFNILMGLQFPFSVVDLYRLRKASCVAIHKMYIRRKKFEPA